MQNVGGVIKRPLDKRRVLAGCTTASHSALVKASIMSVGAHSAVVPNTNTNTAVWVLGDHELGSDATDISYIFVEKTAG